VATLAERQRQEIIKLLKDILAALLKEKKK